MRISNRLFNRNIVRKEKIFAIGYNKTGTTSLHDLFRSLGFASYHGIKWRACDDLGLLKAYTCFSDGIPKDFKFLDRKFPNSKFILQVRELDKWIYSRLAHIEREKNSDKHKGSKFWDTTEDSIRHWIKIRNEHHLAVMSYFGDRPADLLIVNFIRDKAAATKISNFLGFIGRYEKPRKNIKIKKSFPSEHIKMVKNCVTELGINEIELKFDILCPSLIKNNTKNRFPIDTGII